MKTPYAPSPDLREAALGYYVGPFKFDRMGGYIWATGNKDTHGNQMFADLEGAKERCARIRGWGALQYLTHVNPEHLQDQCGTMFAEALTQYWDREKNTLVATIPALSQHCPELNLILDKLTEFGIAHWLTIEPGQIAELTYSDHRKLVIPGQGISTALKEGDKVTLQQGRVFVELKPIIIGNVDSITITRGVGDVGWTRP